MWILYLIGIYFVYMVFDRSKEKKREEDRAKELEQREAALKDERKQFEVVKAESDIALRNERQGFEAVKAESAMDTSHIWEFIFGC